MSHDDGDWGDFGSNKNNCIFDANVLANSMLGLKKYVTNVQKLFEESKEKKYGSCSVGFTTSLQYCKEYANGIMIYYKKNIEKQAKSFDMTYSFGLNNRSSVIFNVFEELRKKGVIQECFGKDFPSIIVYDKFNNFLELTFSTQENLKPKIEVSKVPTAQEFINNKLEKLKKEKPKDFNSVQIFLKNASCPLLKKKKFLAGEKIYIDISKRVPIPKPAAIIIDNNNQDKLKSYNDINELVRGE